MKSFSNVFTRKSTKYVTIGMTNLHIYLRLVCFNALLYTGFTKKKKEADSGGKLTNKALVCSFNRDNVKIF